MMRSAIRAVRGGVGLAARAMPADDVVEQRAGGRLAALVEPESRQGRAEIRPPDAGEGPRRRGDIAMTQLDVPAISARCRSMLLGVAGEAAEHAERPGIGVDEAGADAAVGR